MKTQPDDKGDDRAIIRGEAGVPSKILIDFMTEHEKGFYSSNSTPAKAIKIRKKYIAQIEAYINHRLTQFAEEIIGEDEPYEEDYTSDPNPRGLSVGVRTPEMEIRNKLRAEQRATLKEYVKGNDE